MNLDVINILNNLGSKELTLILIGVLIGILIGKKVNMVSMIIKNPVESIITIFILFVVISQFFSNGPINKNNSFDILNFLSNVVLAWMMTKYSVKNDYEEKSKEMAAISYSYSLKCEQSIDHGLQICTLAKEDLEKSRCEADMNCKLSSYINRMKDSLISAKSDIKQNTLNWSFKISSEINNVKKMDKLASEIKDLEEKLQVLDNNDEQFYTKRTNIKSKIRKKTKEIKTINNSINNEIRLAIENAIINQTDVSQIIENSITREGSNTIFEEAKSIFKSKEVSESEKNKKNKEDAFA